ncbi:hypothetical protein CROQUDRAFT_49912, partial [Cronartium quercuum f. sp. fusiforme G11]
FWISKSLFVKIEADLQQHDAYWVQRKDCCGKLGLSTCQKMTAALHELAYGIPADASWLLM